MFKAPTLLVPDSSKSDRKSKLENQTSASVYWYFVYCLMLKHEGNGGGTFHCRPLSGSQTDRVGAPGKWPPRNNFYNSKPRQQGRLRNWSKLSRVVWIWSWLFWFTSHRSDLSFEGNLGVHNRDPTPSHRVQHTRLRRTIGEPAAKFANLPHLHLGWDSTTRQADPKVRKGNPARDSSQAILLPEEISLFLSPPPSAGVSLCLDACGTDDFPKLLFF